MSSNQVTSTDPTVVAQQTRSTTNTATLAYTQLVSTLAQVQADPKSVSQQDLSLLASSVSNAATTLTQAMSGISAQLQSGGNSTTLQAAYQQASDLLGDLGNNVGRLNNALYSGGSTMRLSGSPSAGYSATTVNIPSEGGTASSASTGSLASQAIGQNDPSTGISANTAAVQALQGTPVGNILSAVVQGLVSQVQSGQLNPLTGQTTASTNSNSNTTTASDSSQQSTDATTSTSSGFDQSEYEENAARNTESGGVAANPLLTSFLSALDNYLKQQNGSGGSSNTKAAGKGGGKGGSTTQAAGVTGGTGGTGGTGATSDTSGTSGTTGTQNTASQTSSGAQQGASNQATSGAGGATNQAASGGSGTSTQNAATGGNGATVSSGSPLVTNPAAGNISQASTGGTGTTSQNATQGSGGTTSQSATALPGGDGAAETNTTGIGLGSGVDNSGVLGNPLMGAANINGYIMAVLLECYNAGQKDLLTEAQNLQALNRAKDGVRAQLASARAANTSATDPGGGNSEQVQDLEDQLTSMGDDAQLEQLNLQNLAQNQQQLLQMLSNFMKNTHDDSMAIIRHIGGG